MLELGPISAARLASLASGRGGVPSAGEWPFVLAALAILAFLGTRLLIALGLTRVEGLLVCGLAPLLVLVDAPLGRLGSDVSLAANFAGCLIPAAVGIKIILEHRVPFAEVFLLVGVGVVVSYFSSEVIPERGVLLQYRIPSLAIGLLAAGLLYRIPEHAGAAGFAAGGLGVVVGADVLRLHELAVGPGRVVLGGAGLLDGIILVALLAAAAGELVAMMLRSIVRLRLPTEPAV